MVGGVEEDRHAFVCVDKLFILLGLPPVQLFPALSACVCLGAARGAPIDAFINV